VKQMRLAGLGNSHLERMKGMKDLRGKKSFFRACLVSLIFLSAQAHAVYSCTGPVGGVSIDGSGSIVVAQLAGIHWQVVCNVNVAQNNFEPNACKAIYTHLITAQTTGKTITIHFNDSGSCASHADWTTASGLYFITLN
jgi:hypothetical protein